MTGKIIHAVEETQCFLPAAKLLSIKRMQNSFDFKEARKLLIKRVFIAPRETN